MAKITDRALQGKWNGKDKSLSDRGSRGAGRMVAKRRGAEGWQFYFQYFAPDGKKKFLPIGPYDADGAATWRELQPGERGYTAQAARDRAALLSMLYRDGTRDLHAHFERIREAKERADRAAQEAARQAQEQAKQSTLRQLLDAYSAHLERSGKQSAADAAGIFKLHVYDQAPDLADRRAADVSIDDFVGLIGKVVEAGKGRTAAKLRSYLRAAYSLAIKAKTDPSAPMILRTFGITVNPLASIGAMSHFNKTRDRKLDADEMRFFLKRLEAVAPSVKKDALSVCLFLGGPRPTQLLRIRPADVDLPGETLTQYDPKGSRLQPREHVLPLPKKPLAILRRLMGGLEDDAPLVFSNDGKRALREETVAELATDISAAMVKAKETRQPFQLRDIRRTCETMLASIGVSKDMRAQLQSHGMGGVQNRSYDRHDYKLEKRRELEKWNKHLDGLMAGKSAKVSPIRKAVASAAA